MMDRVHVAAAFVLGLFLLCVTSFSHAADVKAEADDPTRVKAQPKGEEFADIQNKITSFKLDNGLTIILYARGTAPVISCVTYVKTGSVDEHVGITGIAHQLEHLAFKGTPSVGTRNFAAEQSAVTEIDKLYEKIQSFEQKLPAEMRDSFLSLLAQVTSTGGNPEAYGKNVEALAAKWAKDGVTLKDDDKAQLGELVKSFAEKVKNAEQFVEQNQYSNIIDRNGGSGLNAFTSDDCTVYHVSLPANKLELWSALESDRYMNTFPRQLEKEKQVVLEERRMRTDSSPFGKLYEAFLSVAYQAHPYGTAVIGHRSDILEYSREKVMHFYRAHYIPSQTIVAIVGDIDVAAAKTMLTNYFGRIPSAPEPEKLVTVEPAQEGERRLEIEFPAQPMLMLGYHVPERNHPDNAALTVLDEVATGGRASRMYSRLVKTRKANTVGSWMGPGSRYPRIFFFTAEPTDGASTDELEANVENGIEELRNEAPTAEDLLRVVTRYRADVLRQLRSNMGLAQQLAESQALTGDWHDLFKEIQQISAVTPEQVQTVAKKYFTKKNRTVGRIINTSGKEAPETETILGIPVK
jgi:predicted Zn-dependent peptidase